MGHGDGYQCQRFLPHHSFGIAGHDSPPPRHHLNIGSVAGLRLLEAPVHYAASKAAIKGFTESLAKEVGRYGITVNMLAPGILDGGVGCNLPSYRLADYVKHCALGRIGTLTDVSETAAFLISNQNSYMNGATLVMDGGL